MARRENRRWIVGGFLVSAFSGALGVVEACSFPNVEFASDDASTPESSTSDVDAGLEASPVDSAMTPVHPDVDPEGGLKDATSVGEAAVPVDASGCEASATPCDCDGDGYNRIELGAGCDGGGNGKKADCDDRIKAINPGMTSFVDDVWPADSTHAVVGDWDCDGTATRALDYNATCAALSACTGGFLGNPPCGGTADYITCSNPLPLLGLVCSEKTHEMAGSRKQACH